MINCPYKRTVYFYEYYFITSYMFTCFGLLNNKIIRYVVLLTCLLGLVLFSVTPVYCIDYNFTDRSSFNNAINPYIEYTKINASTTSEFFVDSYSTDIENIFNTCINNYNIDPDKILYELVYYTGREYYVIYTSDVYPSEASYIINSSNNSSNTLGIVLSFPEGSSPNITSYRWRYNGSVTVTSNASNSYSVTDDSSNSMRGFKAMNIILRPSNNSSNVFALNNPNYTPDESYTFESVITPIPAQLYAQLFNAYMYARWQEISNKWSNEYANASDFEWVFDNNEDAQIFAGLMGIGSVLESYAVNSYSFYNNVSLNLANGMTMLSSLGTGINDISDRLALAFPDDQAELNDSIAETLLDDTNDTGLTAEKVSNAKSDFDDGISTYEIDTSGSAYSTPFAAIRGGDWSFWSQTTLNNMSSGYSYTYQQTRNTKASNESDIYEENSKSLFDLLGW